MQVGFFVNFVEITSNHVYSVFFNQSTSFKNRDDDVFGPGGNLFRLNYVATTCIIFLIYSSRSSGRFKRLHVALNGFSLLDIP